MTELKIPEPGVMLGVQDPEPKTQQAFVLDLSDDVIEGMIRCAQKGGDMQLALGANPTLHYGNDLYRIPSPRTPSEDELPNDLYLTQPFKALREAHQIPVMSIFKKNPFGVRVNKSTPRIETTRAKNVPPKKSETDKKGLLKKSTQPTKLSTNDLKSSARALSASPSLKPVASPSHNGIVDQVKLDRAPIVHELAIKPQTSDHLREKWRGKPEDFQKALEKVADQESGKWVLRAKAWQELDAWNYDYDSADRELVINAAIKKYDKARISPSDPLWEKLVPKHERGRGKGAKLTTVQKRIAEGPAAAVPKIAVNRAEESSTSSKDDDNSSEKSKGEPMVRTNSKNKKTASEAQAKRLLGKTKTKPAATKPTPTSTPKTSPAKAKAQTNGKKVLSAEIVENSDSSGDEAPPPPKPKAAPKAAEKAKSTEKSAPKPVAKPAPKPAQKRPAPEDEDSSSSSSGIPLSKRHKVVKPQPTSQQRKRSELKQPPPRQPPPRDYSRYNYKNTSPTKSSPLASSPPTNVSDMSSSSDDRLAASTKRKAMDDGRASTKRQISDQVIQRAQNFKAQYDKYAALHYEVERMTHPPQNKLDELIAMHERLKRMKERIYSETGRA